MLKTEKIEFNIDFRKIASGAQTVLDIISGEEYFYDREYIHYCAQLDFLYGADVIDYDVYSALRQTLNEKRRWA